MDSTDRIERSLQELNDDLLQIAGYVISPDHTRDDLYQIMAAAIIAKAQAEPTFLDQKRAYILNFAARHAKNAAAGSRTYLKYVLEEPTSLDDDSLDDPWEDTATGFEMTAADVKTPEESLLYKEEMGEYKIKIQSLTQRNTEVLVMVYQGYTVTEIARELGVTKGAISQQVDRIGRLLK